MAGWAEQKFIGFFRLVDACERPGCPVCRCLAFDARQYLHALLYEQVNDPDTRTRLYASWGFCNWHAWMLRETSDPAFGSSILYADLLRLAGERLAPRSLRRAFGPFARLRRLFTWRQPPVVVERYRRRAVCPACCEMVRAEGRYLHTALRFADDSQFACAYERSQGLCVPHAIRAVALGAGGQEAGQLIDRTLPKWADLRRDLAGFIGKHDYRNRQPFTEAEGTAYLRVFETLTGAPGVFGNDAHREASVAGEPARRTIAELRAEIERLRGELDAARSTDGQRPSQRP